MNLIQMLEAETVAALSEGKKIPDFRPGDTLRVGVKVVEGERSRVQMYEGVCIARSNKGVNSNFTVRKISLDALFAGDRFDRGRAPRRRPPRQALLPPRPPRQIGPYRRAPRHAPGKGQRGQGGLSPPAS
jgi:hypothetical protein